VAGILRTSEKFHPIWKMCSQSVAEERKLRPLPKLEKCFARATIGAVNATCPQDVVAMLGAMTILL
jgi:hypothetical protein